MALTTEEKATVEEVKAALVEIQGWLKPPSEGRDTLSIANDFAMGYVHRPKIEGALAKLDSLLED